MTPKPGLVSVSSLQGKVVIWAHDDPSQAMEKRIEKILQNLDRLRSEQERHSNMISVLNDSFQKHKDAVENQVQYVEQSIQSDRELFHTGDILISLVGLFWLTVGITLSTLSPEFHQWLQ